MASGTSNLESAVVKAALFNQIKQFNVELAPLLFILNFAKKDLNYAYSLKLKGFIDLKIIAINTFLKDNSLINSGMSETLKRQLDSLTMLNSEFEVTENNDLINALAHWSHLLTTGAVTALQAIPYLKTRHPATFTTTEQQEITDAFGLLSAQMMVLLEINQYLIVNQLIPNEHTDATYRQNAALRAHLFLIAQFVPSTFATPWQAEKIPENYPLEIELKTFLERAAVTNKDMEITKSQRGDELFTAELSQVLELAKARKALLPRGLTTQIALLESQITKIEEMHHLVIVRLKTHLSTDTSKSAPVTVENETTTQSSANAVPGNDGRAIPQSSTLKNFKSGYTPTLPHIPEVDENDDNDSLSTAITDNDDQNTIKTENNNELAFLRYCVAFNNEFDQKAITFIKNEYDVDHYEFYPDVNLKDEADIQPIDINNYDCAELKVLLAETTDRTDETPIAITRNIESGATKVDTSSTHSSAQKLKAIVFAFESHIEGLLSENSGKAVAFELTHLPVDTAIAAEAFFEVLKNHQTDIANLKLSGNHKVRNRDFVRALAKLCINNNYLFEDKIRNLLTEDARTIFDEAVTLISNLYVGVATPFKGVLALSPLSQANRNTFSPSSRK